MPHLGEFTKFARVQNINLEAIYDTNWTVYNKLLWLNVSLVWYPTVAHLKVSQEGYASTGVHETFSWLHMTKYRFATHHKMKMSQNHFIID